ncbi:hypothetical protein [Haloferax sp. YSSS75]
MFSLTSFLRSRFAPEEMHVECRDCGTTLDPVVEPCPQCGSTQRSRYQVM